METPNTETKPEPKLRLLNADEPKQIGDIWYRAQWSDTLWTLYDPTLEKPTNHLLCFRRMTPAEENAEELLEALKSARESLSDACLLMGLTSHGRRILGPIDDVDKVLNKVEGIS